jgi:putative membrane protein
MFVVNFKLNFKKILIICLLISVISAVFIEFIASGSDLESAAALKKDESKYDYILTDENYIQILKEVHENIQGSINKTVKFSGFVFRMDDFKKTIFVCGRNTIVNEEDTVAGFLCESSDATKLKDSEWVEITGVIKEGTYNTTMPIIKVGSIKKITAPANTFVK